VQPLVQWKQTVSVTYSERVSVALGTQNAMSILHIVIYGLFGSKIFLHMIS
jgi:hypothetical protein